MFWLRRILILNGLRVLTLGRTLRERQATWDSSSKFQLPR